MSADISEVIGYVREGEFPEIETDEDGNRLPIQKNYLEKFMKLLPKLEYKPMTGINGESFALNIGYLSDILDDNGNIKYKEENGQRSYNLSSISEANQMKIQSLYQNYCLMKNPRNNNEVSNAITESGSICSLESLSSVLPNDPFKQLLGEFENYLIKSNKWKKTRPNDNNDKILGLGRKCGLMNFFDNAYKIVKKKTNATMMNKIDSDIKTGNVKLFLHRCKILAENLDNQGANMDLYVQKNIADAGRRLYENKKKTNELATFKATDADINHDVFVYMAYSPGMIEEGKNKDGGIEQVFVKNCEDIIPKSVLALMKGKNGEEEDERDLELGTYQLSLV